MPVPTLRRVGLRFLLLPGALRTQSPGDHVQLAHLEAARAGGKDGQQLAGDLRLQVGDLTAPLADQVRVRAHVGLEQRGALRKAALNDKTRLPQSLKSPVDRRELHHRQSAPRPLPDLLGAQVGPRFGQHLPHTRPLGRYAQPPVPQWFGGDIHADANYKQKRANRARWWAAPNRFG